MTTEPLIQGVEAHLNAMRAYVSAGDTVRALGAAEEAKRVMQELYYEIWRAYHTSGTGR